MGKKGGWFSAVRKAFIPTGGGDSKEKKEKKPQKTVSKKSWFGKLKVVEPDSSIPESAFATPALRSPPSETEEDLAEPQNEQSEPTKPETETSKSIEPESEPIKPENEPSEPPKPEDEQSEPPKPEDEENKSTKPEVEQSKPKKPEVEPSKPKKPEVEHKNSFKARAADAFRRLLGRSKEEVAAIKLQNAFRRFLARKHQRAMKGSERLKAFVQTQSVKRQAITTLRCMQTLARVQSQVRARRIRMTEENQALQRQLLQKRERELESLRSSDWNNSRRTKEQVDASLQKRVEAAALRERALAYAQTKQQTWRNPSKSANPTFMDPNNPHWGWSWLDRWMAARPWESQSSVDNQEPKGLTRSTSVGPDVNNRLDRSPSVSSPRSPSVVSSRRLAPMSPKSSNDPMLSPRNRRHSIANTSFREESTSVSSPRVSSPRVSSPRVSSPRSTKTKSMIPSPIPSPSSGSTNNMSPLGSGKKGASENKAAAARPASRRMSLAGPPATSGGGARRLSVPPPKVRTGTR